MNRCANAFLPWLVAVASLSALPSIAESRKHDSDGPLAFKRESLTSEQVFQFGVARWTVPVINTGISTIRIVQIKGNAAGSTGFATPQDLAPGTSSLLTLSAPVGDTLGLQPYAFTILSSTPQHPSQRISLSAFVESAYLPERISVDFGSVRRARIPDQIFEIRSFETPALEVKGFGPMPDWLRVKALPRTLGESPQTVRLRIQVSPDAPAGSLQHALRVRTNVTNQPEVVASIRANIFENVVADPFPLWLGAIHLGTTVDHSIELRTEISQQRKITSIHDDAAHFDVAQDKCGKNCTRLIVRSHAFVAKGAVRGNIVVSFDDGDILKIPYEGSVVSANAQIHRFGEIGNDADIRVDGRLKEQ
jgi:hypothetical protein